MLLRYRSYSYILLFTNTFQSFLFKIVHLSTIVKIERMYGYNYNDCG